MTTHDDVRRICAALPGAVQGDERFGFGVEVKGKVKGFCWTCMERVHPKKPKVENPDVLAVLVPGLGAKAVLLSSEPERYAVDPHYDGFPAVLVRLDRIDPEELADLLTEAWRCKAPKALLEAFDEAVNPDASPALQGCMDPNEDAAERGTLSPNADPNAGPGTTETDATFPDGDGDAPPDPAD